MVFCHIVKLVKITIFIHFNDDLGSDRHIRNLVMVSMVASTLRGHGKYSENSTTHSPQKTVDEFQSG